MSDLPPRPSVVERATYYSEGLRDGRVVTLLREGILPILSRWSRETGSARGKLLDVGCGRQPFRKNIEDGGMKYLSLDVATHEKAPPDFICRIDEPLPDNLLASGPFDRIICVEVLEHTYALPIAFQNFSKLLRDGGEILITTPFVFPLHEEPWDFWRPTLNAYRQLAKENGFEIVLEQKLGNSLSVVEVVLGHYLLYFRYAQVSDWVNRVFQKLVRRLIQLLIRVMRLSAITKFQEAIPQIYLTNLIVLRK